MDLKKNERMDDLNFEGLKIIQNSKEFCFGIDSVLLADFAKNIKAGAEVIDLGTGSGVIATLLCGKTKLKSILGVEIQKNICDMAKRSIALNQLEGKFQILNEDIKNLDKVLENQMFDVVITNPPYQKMNTGLKGENRSKVIARHEVECTLEDIIKISSKLLKDKGEFYIVHRTERLAEIISTLKKYKLEPKILRLVQGTILLKPNLILIKAVKNGHEFLEVEKTLIIYKEDGNYTDEILQIYGKERK